MLKQIRRWDVGLLLAAALTAGCSEEGTSNNPPLAHLVKATDQTAQYRLSAEPAGAKGVIETRKEARDGDEVIVVGRIAGSADPLVKGRAAFTIVDLTLEPCDDETPWVYCCTPKEDLLPAIVLVKFVDEQGKTLPHDARELLRVKEWQTVVVRGQAQRDRDGNLTAVVASGLYVRP